MSEFCSKCGVEVVPGADFCTKCGNPTAPSVFDKVDNTGAMASAGGNCTQAAKRFNTSGIVMFMIGAGLFALAFASAVIDKFLGKVVQISDIIKILLITVPFIVGGAFFACVKVKCHWLYYIAVIAVCGLLLQKGII